MGKIAKGSAQTMGGMTSVTGLTKTGRTGTFKHRLLRGNKQQA